MATDKFTEVYRVFARNLYEAMVQEPYKLNEPHDWIVGYYVSEIIRQKIPRTFWQWLTRKTPDWDIYITFAGVEDTYAENQ